MSSKQLHATTILPHLGEPQGGGLSNQVPLFPSLIDQLEAKGLGLRPNMFFLEISIPSMTPFPSN